MVLLITLLCLPAQEASIGSTPEWAAYKRELAKHKSIQVELYFYGGHKTAGDDGRDFQLTINSNGDFDLDSASEDIKWIKDKGIKIDRLAKTWKPISKVEGIPSSLSMLGLLDRGNQAGQETWDAAWKQTRELYASRSDSKAKPAKEIGYTMSSYHIDAGYAETWWFDVKTHLITQIETQSIGPMADDTIQRSLYIRFNFDLKPTTRIDLTPPPGYKRTR